MKSLSKTRVLKALKRLDELAPKTFEMVIGGGVAMLCAYDSPLHTWDVDAILKHITLDQIKKAATQVAKELNLPADWLNSWFSSFTHNLPPDFSDRLQLIFKGKKITGYALGKEDLLILKCCAHRTKDKGHARLLIRKKTNHRFVMKHLEQLLRKKLLPDAKPIEFLEDLLDEELT